MKSRWRKAVKVAAVALGSLFALVTLIGLCLPKSIRVERSVLVNAKARDIYPFIADFKHGWPGWNPFAAEIADARMTYAGPDIGVGAQQGWDSEKGGEGHMTITSADPEGGIAYDLRLMHDSFRLDGSLICEPAEGGTRVRWTDNVEYGGNPYQRYMGLIVEKPLGDALDKGLQALKTKVEARVVAGSP